MAGTALEEFTTFMASQGPAWASGPENLVNEAVKHTYTYPRLTRGKSMMDMVQGGDQITDKIFFTENSRWKRYNPNSDFSYTSPQSGVIWTVPWSFATTHIVWTKHELGLNKDTTTKKYRAQKYKSVMYEKHQDARTDVCNSMDAELWAQPSFADMETGQTPTDARVPYSIPCFVTEDTGGVPLGSDAAAWGGATDTVMGIDISANPRWDNQRELYGGTGGWTGATAIGAASIFAPMSRLMHQLKFDRLPKDPQYSEKTTSPHFIGTTLTGLSNYEHALRLNQDTFRGMGQTSGQDPHYNNPTFRGVPLDRIEELETAALYDDGSSALDTEANASISGPRYWFLNGEYLKVVFHSENYLVWTEPMRPTAQPFSRVQVLDCWNNLICRSRRRQGILSPEASTTDA